MKRDFHSGTPWETDASYRRAVRRGDRVFVSGTTAMRAADLVGAGDAAAQTRYIFQKIETALHALGATLGDVVRTRMYITRAQDAGAVTEVHGEVMREVLPAATLVVVAALIDPRLLVEIEVDALVQDDPSS